MSNHGDHSENFRTEIAAKLFDRLPQDQLRGGMPLDKLQALMGHAKPETTLIYAKEDRVDLQREHMRVYA